MTPMEPELVATVIAAMYLFTSIAVQKRIVQWKHVDRVYPSCQRNTRDWRCVGGSWRRLRGWFR